ncbi:type IV pilus assembly protein PilW [Novimethylophilus kurashikiensis]|uniref:Type IV pilus assembly protein PilW n=1 Tax=Novimethylophilus kurashikiensis TaxID=1825523 RepID=A0A2R5F186_9PROT|nr:PilW family protein [Novimethylophilus kurashikiensis]GBG12506.1 type IV pilus assembly protein PilW [Novimethylophilus kurashikiensis]
MSAIHSKTTSPLPRGFSLIELMISLAIGMILMLAIGYIYVGGSRVFRELEATSRLQESARYVMERIGRDLRMTGFAGCSYTTTANVLNNSSDWQNNLFGMPLVGFQEGSLGIPAQVAGQMLRGDVLIALLADNSKEYIIASHNPASAQFQLTANHDLKQGEILLATDCSHAAVFQMTNVNNNNTIKTVNHNTGTGSPGNCTKGFGIPVDCANPTGTAYTFVPGSRLYRVSASAYYIQNNASGEPALYRQKLGYASPNATLTAEEVVEGVENMKITYGVDTDATPDGAVNSYVSAEQVSTVTPGATESEHWARVISVNISLLMATRNDEQIATEPQTYTFNGTSSVASDRRLYKVFNTTIAIRNRI